MKPLNSRDLARAWLCVLALVANGCATSHVAQQRHVTIVPPQAAATLYATEASGDAYAIGDLAEDAKQGLQEAHKQGAPALVPDDRLAVIARYAAEYWQTYDQSPSHAALDFLAHHLGLPEPAPHLAMMKAPAGDIAEHIAEEVAKLALRGQYTHVGVYAQRSGFVAEAVVVMSFRHLSLEPLPREVALGTQIDIKGSLAKSFTQPTLVLVTPDGQSTRTTLGNAHKFSTKLTLDQRGEYRVELLGEGKQGIIVAANFPIYAGVAAPEKLEILSTSAESATPQSLSARLLELANADRAKVNLPPLQADTELAEVASAHNQDMIDHGFVGHTSPTTGSAVERVKSANLPSSLVLENIGRDYSAEELEQGWMSSPGHRANLLHPQATHVGIDARILPSSDDGPPQILATEVFIRRTPSLPSDPAGELIDAINDARTQRNSPKISLDNALSANCQKAAERYFSAPKLSSAQLLSDLQTDHVNGPARGRHVASTLMFTTDLTEVAKAPQLHDPSIAAIGLGIAQGRRPGASDDEIAVAITLVY